MQAVWAINALATNKSTILEEKNAIILHTVSWCRGKIVYKILKILNFS
jgi:hypothetical protein